MTLGQWPPRLALAGHEIGVSRVCLGTMTFGVQVDTVEARRMVDHALARGVDFLDTSNIYARGQSEEILGEVLRGRRQRVFLATKVGMELDPSTDIAPLSRAAIRRDAEASLRRLRTDYLDLYILHRPDPRTPIEQTLAALDELVAEGKVRFVGVSNYSASQVRELVGLARQQGPGTLRFVQSMYNLLARGVEPELLPLCDALGLLSMAHNPLAGGLLTGKYVGADRPPAGSRFDRIVGYQARYWKQAFHGAVQQLVTIGAGCPPGGVALRWLLHHTPISIVVLGASSFAQLEQNLEHLAQGPLPETVVDAVDALWPALAPEAPSYFV